MQDGFDAYGPIPGYSPDPPQGPFVPANVVLKDVCAKKRQVAATAVEAGGLQSTVQKASKPTGQLPPSHHQSAGAEDSDEDLDPRHGVLALVGVAPSARILDDEDDFDDLPLEQPSSPTRAAKLENARAAVKERLMGKRTAQLADLTAPRSKTARVNPSSALVTKVFQDVNNAEMVKTAGVLPDPIVLPPVL